MNRNFRSGLAVLLCLAYPALVYYWLEHGSGGLAPALLALLFAWRGVATHGRARAGLLSVSLLLAAGSLAAPALTATAAPALIHLGLAVMFARTLQHGPSLVERLVRLEYPYLPPGVEGYCRQITAAWATLFTINAVICLLLAATGNRVWWALFNGGGVFIPMVLLAVGEYLVRRWRFPALIEPAPAATMLRILRNSRPLWRELFVAIGSGRKGGND